MRAVIEICMAIAFTIIMGAGGLSIASKIVKKEAIIKVSGGLGSLDTFPKN